ncbi:unnamed protein product [Phytophthora fragariaefolia]|uniref:Unnamed protein product n=1 Tax=Phytophthora fragariaefolia TaxID=1490495 RepID=A0A9W6XJR7_9STRA|nr:unnamed protein product [Phytophthora fragariaefolia]
MQVVWRAAPIRPLDLIQIKNKFNAVKALYGQTKAEETATGNAEKPIEYPSYWSLLVQYFGDKKGLRNQDFGQSGVQLPPFAAQSSDSEGSIPDSEVDEDPGVDDTGGTEEHSREEPLHWNNVDMMECARSASWTYRRR